MIIADKGNTLCYEKAPFKINRRHALPVTADRHEIFYIFFVKMNVFGISYVCSKMDRPRYVRVDTKYFLKKKTLYKFSVLSMTINILMRI